MSAAEIWRGLVDTIINPAVGLLFAAAVLLFLYGVMRFFVYADNDEVRTASKKHMIWGIVGIAIMASAWAIVAFLRNTLGV